MLGSCVTWKLPENAAARESMARYFFNALPKLQHKASLSTEKNKKIVSFSNFGYLAIVVVHILEIKKEYNYLVQQVSCHIKEKKKSLDGVEDEFTQQS